jgi:2-keto-4-pentenoate hydratase/2-oxohepta-3-ene-1,7-dioic acid hydratase in catechol pathway
MELGVTTRCARSRTEPDVSSRDPVELPGLRYWPATCCRRARCRVAGFKSPEERARLYLKPGDVIEAEIEGIGILRTP